MANLFRVYKPKSILQVRAVLVTTENVQQISNEMGGRLTYDDAPTPKGTKVKTTGFEVATFDGVKKFPLGEYFIRMEDGSLKSMNAEEFDSQFELARNTRS